MMNMTCLCLIGSTEHIMIGFNNFGNQGHLGNQMFQYAALKGISRKRGYGWCIPNPENFGKYYDLKSNIYQCFDLKCNFQIINGSTIQEKYFHFLELFSLLPRTAFV